LVKQQERNKEEFNKEVTANTQNTRLEAVAVIYETKSINK